jgi:2'-5' RNA ligase
VDEATLSVGVPKEDHAYSPHLTLARGGGRSGAPHMQRSDGPNMNFQLLQEKLAAMSSPEFGTMTAHEFFLFQSQLMQGGSRYTRIARFPLA